MLINADLHIHSPFSGGTSDAIDLRRIAAGAKMKGLQLVATGDCLHPAWQREIKKYERDGAIVVDGVHFVLGVEVEDKNRVHHVVLFPDFPAVDAFKKSIERHSPNMREEGRPRVSLSGAEILERALETHALLGPAHAFTPWTSLYAYFDSMIEYYEGKPSFIELGLSADTGYADRISELHSLPFLTNSDAHSYMPHRLGREFNRLEVEEITWDGMRRAIQHNRIVLNVGLPPEKGKYHRTACSSCHRQYEMEMAAQMHWRCHCGGTIKKGVRDRIEELADSPKGFHPEGRPPYVHLIPLAEIIGHALDLEHHAGVVKRRWEELSKLGSEIDVLLDIDISLIRKSVPPAVADAIAAFRNGTIHIVPGGGGKYGEVILP